MSPMLHVMLRKLPTQFYYIITKKTKIRHIKMATATLGVGGESKNKYEKTTHLYKNKYKRN